DHLAGPQPGLADAHGPLSKTDRCLGDERCTFDSTLFDPAPSAPLPGWWSPPPWTPQNPSCQQTRVGRYFFAAACFSRNSLIICSCVARGTGWYLANSMENSPLPWVAERRSVEYPNISEICTCALAIR